MIPDFFYRQQVQKTRKTTTCLFEEMEDLQQKSVYLLKLSN